MIARYLLDTHPRVLALLTVDGYLGRCANICVGHLIAGHLLAELLRHLALSALLLSTLRHLVVGLFAGCRYSIEALEE